jgi:hypothetical protein
VSVTPDADLVVELETLGTPTATRLSGWIQDVREALELYHRAADV